MLYRCSEKETMIRVLPVLDAAQRELTGRLPPRRAVLLRRPPELAKVSYDYATSQPRPASQPHAYEQLGR